MAKTKDTRQEEIKGMESPKNAKLERAGRGYRSAIAIRLDAQKDEKNKKAKVRELMHEGEKEGQVRRIVEQGVEFLVYQRANMNIRVKIKEDVKVLLDEEVGAEDEGDASAVPDDDADVEVSE